MSEFTVLISADSEPCRRWRTLTIPPFRRPEESLTYLRSAHIRPSQVTLVKHFPNGSKNVLGVIRLADESSSSAALVGAAETV